MSFRKKTGRGNVSGLTIVDKEVPFMEKRYQFKGLLIVSAGYNAQCELLEIEFGCDKQIWQYLNVPEAIWYRFKYSVDPDGFFHKFIKGQYTEQRMVPEM